VSCHDTQLTLVSFAAFFDVVSWLCVFTGSSSFENRQSRRLFSPGFQLGLKIVVVYFEAENEPGHLVFISPFSAACPRQHLLLPKRFGFPLSILLCPSGLAWDPTIQIYVACPPLRRGRPSFRLHHLIRPPFASWPITLGSCLSSLVTWHCPHDRSFSLLRLGP